jgi:hypothetical protein
VVALEEVELPRDYIPKPAPPQHGPRLVASR